MTVYVIYHWTIGSVNEWVNEIKDFVLKLSEF